LNKKELIDAIANGAGLQKNEAELALNSTLDAIGDALKSGDKLTLVGFGTSKTN
jgi:DNA-binding protein HU-beta